MDLTEFLCSRRSVRRFTPEEVPYPVIEQLIKVATLAPSSHNRQPWRFAVVIDSARKVELAETMGEAFRRDLEDDDLPNEEVERRIDKSRSRITSAPVVVILCMDTSEMDQYPDPVRQIAERTMALQSVAMAGLQLLLAAHAAGLGGVWNCGPLFAPATVSQALGLPGGWEPQGMLLLGHPAEQPVVRPRKSVDEIILIR